MNYRSDAVPPKALIARARSGPCRPGSKKTGDRRAGLLPHSFFILWTLLLIPCSSWSQEPSPPAAPPPTEAAPTPAPFPTPLPARSTVFCVHDAAAVTERYQADPERIRSMVNRLVAVVTGQPDAARGWRTLIEPKDIVGIKINAAAGGAAAPAHRAVVAAVVESLIAAGHPRERIVVWDRDFEDLRDAGYITADGHAELPCAVRGIEPRAGYDPKATVTAAVLGKMIWGDLLFEGQRSPLSGEADATRPPRGRLQPGEEGAVSGPPPRTPFAAESSPVPDASASPHRSRLAPSSVPDNLSEVSHFALIVSKQITKIVNVPVMSDCTFSGIAGALYNVTIPDLDNWRRFTQEPRYGNPYIAEIYSEPLIGPRVVLNLMDGTVAQIAGGPAFDPHYARAHATLYASKDPVALDGIALRYIELWRAQRGLPALDKMADHIRAAADAGIGYYDAEKIDLRTVSQ